MIYAVVLAAGPFVVSTVREGMDVGPVARKVGRCFGHRPCQRPLGIVRYLHGSGTRCGGHFAHERAHDLILVSDLVTQKQGPQTAYQHKQSTVP